MALVLNTEKTVASLKLCLAKKGITPVAVDVAIAMDVSGSFHNEHMEGITTDLVTRLLPWGLVFDPDQKLGFYTFSDGDNVQATEDLTKNNYQGYINNNVVWKVKGYGQGTDYAPVIEKILKDTEGKSGFLGFGKKAAKPLFVLFVTDGENSDPRNTRKVISGAIKDGRPVYIQFIGVNSEPSTFGTIKELGDDFENVGFTTVTDIKKFVNLSDEDLNNELISQEMIDWFSSKK